MEEEKSEKTSPVLEKNKMKKFLPIFSVVIVIFLGILTGYYLVTKTKPGYVGSLTDGAQTGEEIGSSNEKVFKDNATGILEKGGIDGEGTHKLIREGGVSQTVYLTSSVIDLDQLIGKKIQVFGETFKAQKAGWLMDVGKVKILE